MPKVRPADGIPVMPHIEQKVLEDIAFVHRTYAEQNAEWLKWEADHPSLAPIANTIAGFYQGVCHPSVLPLPNAIELMKGLLINFRLALVMAESLEAHLATKQ